jgi:hypothetical protein
MKRVTGSLTLSPASTEAYIRVDGTIDAGTLNNVSTTRGGGNPVSPHLKKTTSGYSFLGMRRVSVSGTDYWRPVYRYE